MQNQRAWGGEKQHTIATTADHTAGTAFLSSEFVGYRTWKQSARPLQNGYKIV